MRVFFKKFVIWLLVISTIFCGWSVSFSAYLNLHHNIPYKAKEYFVVSDYIVKRPEAISKQWLKMEIDYLFDNPEYTYREKKLNPGVLGTTQHIFRLITISPSIDYENYVLTLSHELVHLTKMTGCERYCNFEAFKILYESGNEYFKKIALVYAQSDIEGFISRPYACAGYIEEYLGLKTEVKNG